MAANPSEATLADVRNSISVNVPAETITEPVNDEDFDDEDLFENWGDVIDVISNATRKAYASSPAFDANSTAAFQTYWKGVFTQLHASVESNPNIPEYLTEPPTKKFEVRFFDRQDGLCCPCGHPDVEANIVLHNGGGVTKGGLVKAVSETLYGYSKTEVWQADRHDDDLETESDDDKDRHQEKDAENIGALGPLIYEADWMSAGGNVPNGESRLR